MLFSFRRALCIAWAMLLIGAGSALATHATRPVAVIYFNDGSEAAEQHARMISRMVRELTNFHPMPINDIMLTDPSALPTRLEQLADDNTGMVLLIEPPDTDAFAKLPSLYPDMNFTVIGTRDPLYMTNVRTMVFREQEGLFMMGALAALRSQNGIVGFACGQDTPETRNLAYAFLQGAKHVKPDIKITQHLGMKAANPKAEAQLEGAEGEMPDVLFIHDDALLDTALQAARKNDKLLITYNHDVLDKHPGQILTSLLKHYDLAMYQALRSYARNEWKAGSQSLGIGSGFMDYSLTQGNRHLLPKETIEQMETIKDFIAQGHLQVNSLGQ